MKTRIANYSVRDSISKNSLTALTVNLSAEKSNTPTFVPHAKGRSNGYHLTC